MAHKTLVNGTEYEVKGGKCLVDATSYEIKKGRTLVGGTGYDIPFLVTINITTNNENVYEYDPELCWLSIEGKVYNYATTITVPFNTLVRCELRNRDGGFGAMSVYIDNRSVFSSKEAVGVYDLYVTSNITIDLRSGYGKDVGWIWINT